MRERAKTHLPTVLLTLISIVQALALELLWSKVMASGSLHVWSNASITIWLQVIATFTGIVLVWVLYANNIMRFRWVPDTFESIAPFIIGILQFSIAFFIGPTTSGEWLMAMAITFTVMAIVMQRMLRIARADEDNAAYFAGWAPATWRDFADVMAASGILFSTGVVLYVTDYRGIGVPIIIAICWLLLLLQLYRAHIFWNRSVSDHSIKIDSAN